MNNSPAWQALTAQQQRLASIHLRDLFADEQRFQKFSLKACDIVLDFSKNRLDEAALVALFALAQERHTPQWIARQFSGEKINHTENRAVLHTALRYQGQQPIVVDGEDVMPKVRAVLNHMGEFSEQVRRGQWRGYTGKRIKTLVNIGIGGSDLGPKMVDTALEAYKHPQLQSFYVSNLDALHIQQVLKACDPETSLFIIASKTFSTQETLSNAYTARQWFLNHAQNEAAIEHHFVAVSTNAALVEKFGINTNNMFGFWDWVGGRYSLWSAIGLPLVIMLGRDNFHALLKGAYAMDVHFQTAPLARNMPVILGLIGLWYDNFFNASTQAILPYDYALQHLPAYLQQLEMESNGKRTHRNGASIADMKTCPVIWGAAGNNGQHAFYQLLHQGQHLIPADFIVAAQSQADNQSHQAAVLANALAQTQALMAGRNEAETRQQLQAEGLSEAEIEHQLPHRIFAGNQPSNTLLYKKLTPEILGSLIALYEHKVFVQSVCWDINAYDQWGVELGKQMAAVLLPEIEARQVQGQHDASTTGLLKQIFNGYD